MARPTTPSYNLASPVQNSLGIKLNFESGNGDRRIVCVTEGNDIRYPEDGFLYEADIHFGLGTPLHATYSPGTQSCTFSGGTTYSSTNPSSTYVVYNGLEEGSKGIDIINLDPATDYNIIIYEFNDSCYLQSDTLKVSTNHSVNTEQLSVVVYDNQTRVPIKNASVSIKGRTGFLSGFGTTGENGLYRVYLEEGRYEMSIVHKDYDPKILNGIFIQRKEPRRDNYYRIFTAAGNTEIGGSVERRYLNNNYSYNVFLDKDNKTYSSFNKYQPTDNPDSLTKL